MDLANDFARHIVSTTYDDLDDRTRTVTKQFILDTFATLLGGSTAPGCREVVDLVKHWGGRKESSILVYGGKVPAPCAALANGTMAHALDLDDTHDEAVVHANISALPAALAVSEALGGVDGKTFLTAVALGVDVACRIALADRGALRWILSATCGVFGSAAAAAKVMGLNEEKTRHALGIAYSQCAGNVQALVDGALVKRMQPAFSSQVGVTAAFLSQRGITGAREVFEGKYGYYALYSAKPHERERALDGLGKRFEGVNLSAKQYPSCKCTHAGLDAALKLAQRLPRDTDIEAVKILTTRHNFNMVGRPFEWGENLQVSAQFSLPYTVAAALLRKDFFIDDLSEDKIKDARVNELARKTTVIPVDDGQNRDLVPATVEVKTSGGHTFQERVEVVKGHPLNPLTFEEFKQKFLKCNQFSAHPLSEKKAQGFIKKVERLEKISDCRNLVRQLKEGKG